MKATILLLLASCIHTIKVSVSFRYRSFVYFHNQNPTNTWKAKINKGWDYKNPASLRKKCGTQIDPDAPTSEFADGAREPANPSRLLQSLPASYDLRTAYPKCWSISYIRNQGSCGACWAVSSASSLSDRYCIQKSTASVVAAREFSYEDILECCTKANCGTGPNMGCNGGFISGGFVHSLKVGTSTGANYGNFTTCKPYFLKPSALYGTAPSCALACTNTTTYKTPYARDLLKISGYKILRGITAAQTMSSIQNAIYARGSVIAYMQVFDDFFTYSTGVYQKTSTTFAGGHAVRVIGWGSTTVRGKVLNYWIVANSWGTNWGLNGFFWIIKGVNNCSIESIMTEGLL